jgi:hypothetical protein
MSSPTRPTFFEGQVLRAADLTLSADHARGQLARHERYLHSPGVATGLALSVDDSTGVKQVKVSPGLAIDGTGREILVDREEQLPADLFSRLHVALPDDPANKDAWYPAFLVGRDEPAPPSPLGRGCAAGAARSSQLAEAYDFTFGRPGDEALDPLADAPPAVADGPGEAEGARVLIGFVQWDASANAGAGGFADAKAAPAPGLSARYAGVAADEVAARGGALALRARPVPTKDAPALVLDGGDGGELRFGLQDATGKVAEVFKVNAAGDLWVAGKLKPGIPAGLQVESGIAFDGMLVPLPAGVTQDQVDRKQVTLHVRLTPRRAGPPRPPGVSTGDFLMVPVTCWADGRRVHCRYRYLDLGAAFGPGTEAAGACEYLVLAAGSGS